jgi:hypothetical protein
MSNKLQVNIITPRWGRRLQGMMALFFYRGMDRFDSEQTDEHFLPFKAGDLEKTDKELAAGIVNSLYERANPIHEDMGLSWEKDGK